MIDTKSLVLGYLTCMFADIIFSFAHMMLERALLYRAERRKLKRKEVNEDD